MRMRLLRTSPRLSLTLLALDTVSVVASAQSPSALGLRKVVFDDQPVQESVLLLPLSGQSTSNRIDGLLAPPKHWPRHQGLICVMNYTLCAESWSCCPDGNVCCPGEFSRLLANKLPEGIQLMTPVAPRWNVLWRRVRLPLPIGVCMMSSMLPTAPHRAYCTTVGGVQGCCKLGHICNRILEECTIGGQQRCPNENFCCGEHALESQLPLSIDADNFKIGPKPWGMYVIVMRTAFQDVPRAVH